MSTLSDEITVMSYSLGGKIERMPKSQLPALIQKAREHGLSFRDIRARSGDKIPLSTLNDYDKCRPPNPNPTVETILALARGLGESPTVVFEAVIGKTGSAVKDEAIAQLLQDWSSLPAKDREDLKTSFEMLRTEVQRRLNRNT